MKVSNADTSADIWLSLYAGWIFGMLRCDSRKLLSDCVFRRPSCTYHRRSEFEKLTKFANQMIESAIVITTYALQDDMKEGLTSQLQSGLMRYNRSDGVKTAWDQTQQVGT